MSKSAAGLETQIHASTGTESTATANNQLPTRANLASARQQFQRMLSPIQPPQSTASAAIPKPAAATSSDTDLTLAAADSVISDHHQTKRTSLFTKFGSALADHIGEVIHQPGYQRQIIGDLVLLMLDSKNSDAKFAEQRQQLTEKLRSLAIDQTPLPLRSAAEIGNLIQMIYLRFGTPVDGRDQPAIEAFFKDLIEPILPATQVALMRYLLLTPVPTSVRLLFDPIALPELRFASAELLANAEWSVPLRVLPAAKNNTRRKPSAGIAKTAVAPSKPITHTQQLKALQTQCAQILNTARRAKLNHATSMLLRGVAQALTAIHPDGFDDGLRCVYQLITKLNPKCRKRLIDDLITQLCNRDALNSHPNYLEKMLYLMFLPIAKLPSASRDKAKTELLKELIPTAFSDQGGFDQSPLSLIERDTLQSYLIWMLHSTTLCNHELARHIELFETLLDKHIGNPYDRHQNMMLTGTFPQTLASMADVLVDRMREMASGSDRREYLDGLTNLLPCFKPPPNIQPTAINGSSETVALLHQLQQRALTNHRALMADLKTHEWHYQFAPLHAAWLKMTLQSTNAVSINSA